LYCNDTTVTNNVTYYYRVSAKNTIGEGPLSNEISATPRSTGRQYNDSDNDLIPDEWEREFGLNFTNSSDAHIDFDNDNLTNFEEFLYNTNPFDYDTDNDTLSDGDEIKIYNTNPTNPDTDGDGFNDGVEIENNTDPLDDQDYPTNKEIKKNPEPADIGIYLFLMIIVNIFLIFIIIFLILRIKRKKNEEI
jgi:hypothetical protein